MIVCRDSRAAQALRCASRVAKTRVIYADVYQACTLLFWRDRDRQLYPLAKDADAHERRAIGHDLRSGSGSYCADFVVDAGELAGAHALGVVVGDGDRVRLLQYAPLGSDTDRGGQRLIGECGLHGQFRRAHAGEARGPGRIPIAMRRRSRVSMPVSTGRSARSSRATKKFFGGCGL